MAHANEVVVSGLQCLSRTYFKKKKVGGVFCSHLRSRSGRCRGGASLPWNAGAAEPATAHLAPGRAPKFLLSCGRRRGEAAARGRPARCPAGRPGVGGGRGCGLRARGGAGGGATARPAPPRGPFCGRGGRGAVTFKCRMFPLPTPLPHGRNRIRLLHELICAFLVSVTSR